MQDAATISLIRIIIKDLLDTSDLVNLNGAKVLTIQMPLYVN